MTARGEERDRVTGLRTGADDYVVKPFSMAELNARIEAVLRRAARAAPAGEVLVAGPVRIDVAARRVTVDGREIALTRKEFDILAVLARTPGVVVTCDRIILDVWQTTSWAGTRSTCTSPRCAPSSAFPGWCRPCAASATGSRPTEQGDWRCGAG